MQLQTVMNFFLLLISQKGVIFDINWKANFSNSRGLNWCRCLEVNLLLHAKILALYSLSYLVFIIESMCLFSLKANIRMLSEVLEFRTS